MTSKSDDKQPYDQFGRSHNDCPRDTSNPNVQTEASYETEEHRESRLLRILDCADQIRNQIDAKPKDAFRLRGYNYLTSPVLDARVEGEESQILLNWVNFHPYRPALVTLYCTPVPKRKERLLSLVKYHISKPQEAVFGLIPGNSSITPVEDAVAALFTANGHPSCRLLEWMPTSLAHRDNWGIDKEAPLLSGRVTRGLFYVAVRQVWPSHIGAFCDHLRRYRDPWKRIEAALEWRAKSEQTCATGEKSSFNDSHFLEWFTLATAPDQVAAERNNFAELWAHASHLASRDRPRVN